MSWESSIPFITAVCSFAKPDTLVSSLYEGLPSTIGLTILSNSGFNFKPSSVTSYAFFSLVLDSFHLLRPSFLPSVSA
jgi:hypothetical protein